MNFKTFDINVLPPKTSGITSRSQSANTTFRSRNYRYIAQSIKKKNWFNHYNQTDRPTSHQKWNQEMLTNTLSILTFNQGSSLSSQQLTQTQIIKNQNKEEEYKVQSGDLGQPIERNNIHPHITKQNGSISYNQPQMVLNTCSPSVFYEGLKSKRNMDMVIQNTELANLEGKVKKERMIKREYNIIMSMELQQLSTSRNKPDSLDIKGQGMISPFRNTLTPSCLSSKQRMIQKNKREQPPIDISYIHYEQPKYSFLLGQPSKATLKNKYLQRIQSQNKLNPNSKAEIPINAQTQRPRTNVILSSQLSRNQQRRQISEFLQKPFKSNKVTNFNFPAAIDNLFLTHTILLQNKQQISPAVKRTKSIMQLRKSQMQQFLNEATISQKSPIMEVQSIPFNKSLIRNKPIMKQQIDDNEQY